MEEELEFWNKLYLLINGPCPPWTINFSQDYGVEITLKRTYLTCNWAEDWESWESCYITSKKQTRLECLKDVIDKLIKEEFDY